MYNAYAGFITSILSVQATGIRSINDLLFNNFKLGYSVADDAYIRVTTINIVIRVCESTHLIVFFFINIIIFILILIL